jgi:adenylate kinase
MLEKRYKIPQISTGDILRSAIKDQAPLGLKAKSFMDAGGLVPDDVVIGIIKDRLMLADCRCGFVLDGFPRTVGQADALKQVLADIGQPVEHVLSISVDNGELLRRITGRRTCIACGRGYHIDFDPSLVAERCDECGGELCQRDDDKEETMLKRLQVYESQTAPLIKYYTEKSLLRAVSGIGSIEEIQSRLVSIVEGGGS